MPRSAATSPTSFWPWVAARSEAELADEVDGLTNAGLVFRRGTPPHAIFLFKHALVRDAAYSTLLRRRRQQLHAAIAAAPERQCLETGAAEPELLAYHCTEAGLAEQAIAYWQRAGEHAIAHSANLEAIAYLNTASTC